MSTIKPPTTNDDNKDDKAKVAQRFEQGPVTFKANGISYLADRVIGKGSFGVVMQAMIISSGEMVAIKRVLQDKNFKNRELQIMSMLSHVNVVPLKDSFYTRSGPRNDEVYLNLVLEYVPETVYRVSRQYAKSKESLPIIFVKLYVFQLCRALAYIHALGVCHRDIKPQNLLLDPNSGILKVCDFGSAKVLVPGETNVSYICSRYYRAPELILQASNYTTSIDIWSMGCVFAELLSSHPLFPGDSSLEQLVEIVQVLGAPTAEQSLAMNPKKAPLKFPDFQAKPWKEVFKTRPTSPPAEAMDLLSKVLQYNPTSRLTAYEVCAHPFFDELRDPNARLPSGKPLPPLFNFSLEEQAAAKDLLRLIIPPWAMDQLQKAPTTSTSSSSSSGSLSSSLGSNPTNPASSGSASASRP